MPSTEYVRRTITSGTTPQMLTAIQRFGPMKRGPHNDGMLQHQPVHITDVLPWLSGKRIERVEGKIQYESGHTEETFVDMRFELEDGLLTSPFCVRDCEEYQDEVNMPAESYRLDTVLHGETGSSK